MKKLIIFICIFSSIDLFGQAPHTITGKVRSRTGEALGSANIILKKLSSDSAIIAFSLTQTDGSFHLEIPEGSTGKLSLSVSIIGYSGSDKILEAGRSYSNLEFVLETKTLVLKEVVVRDKPGPFRAKNDTTTYNMSQYTDGTERKVEDLLRKLPGIKVDENGTITFKGKAIDKIMLEGDDFFEKNYKLLSKNVSAALVEKIQAIENYNENNLLKGIQRSDKVVLNLRLKKKFVSSLFGNAELSVGDPRLYNLNTTLFSFINTFKAGFLGNINNTGFDALDDAKYNLSSNDAESGHLNSDAAPLQLPVTNELVQSLSISKIRYLTNRARLGALQVSTPITPKIKFNLYGYWQKDERQLLNNNFTRYLLPDSVFTVRENGSNTHTPLAGFARWKVHYSIDSVSSLNYTGSVLSSRPELHYQYQVLENSSPAQNTVARVQGDNTANFHRLTYIRRFSYAGALVTEVEYRDGGQEQYNRVSPNRYEKIFDKGDSSFSALQYFSLNERRWNVNTRWLGVKGSHNYELSLAYSHYDGNLYSDLQVQKDMVKLPVNDSLFHNLLDYRKHTWAAEVKDELTWGRFRYNAAVAARFIQLQTRQAETGQRNTSFVNIEPSVSISYMISNKTRLRLQARQAYNISGLADLYSNYVLADYRNFISGSPVINRSRETSINLNLAHTNSDKYVFIYLAGGYQQQNRPFASALVNDSNVNFINRVPVDAFNYSFNLNGEASKYIPVLQSRTGITTTYLRTRLNSFVNSTDLRNNTLTSAGAGFYVVTAFDKWFNFDFENNYTATRLKNNGELDAESSLLKNSFLRQKLSLRFRPAKWLNIRLTGEQFRWESFSGVTTTNFLDALIKITPAKSRYSIELKGLNLLNNKQLVYNSISNILVMQNTYRLNPRYAMLTLSFDF